MDLAPYAAAAPKSGGHWYHPDGRACHTVPYAGKRVGERPTTLRDAKKMKLLPSVTTILQVIFSMGLVWFKQRQTAMAAIRTPMLEDESEDVWFSRVLAASEEVVTEAAELGSSVHKAIEDLDKTGTYDSQYRQYVDPVTGVLDSIGYESEMSERRVTNLTEGYAGTVDGLGFIGGDKTLIDFKTRKSTNGKFRIYDKDRMQCAAYAAAYYGDLNDIRLFNIYISTTQPGLVEAVEHSDNREHFDAFLAAAKLWRYLNNYDPRTRTL